MSNNPKSNGSNLKVSNAPGKNGASSWENAGNLFMDVSGRFGTLYLEFSTSQLETLLAESKANSGNAKKKFNVFKPKPKSTADAARAPSA